MWRGLLETQTNTCTLQDIFVAGFGNYAAGRVVHPRELNAARCISQCYTPALGLHLQFCGNGDYEQIHYHACRHRSCPKCGACSRQAWVDAQFKRLLPCPHFHVIFTLPHSLLVLWENNRRWFISTLFDCARRSLLELLADPRHLGATPGLMMSLHTWGRDLSRHPHLHCLVTAGGVDADGQWKSTKPNQLVPFEALHKLYRGKVLAALRDALKSGQLQLPKCIDKDSFTKQLGPLYAKHWNVRIEPQYQHGEGLTVYLARYAKGGPLPQERELRMQDGQVQFEYTSHRDQRLRTLRLGVPQFIERMLWHAPPRAVHTTRHSGLYSTPYRKQHALARTSLSTAPKPAPWPRPRPEQTAEPKPAQPGCPKCGATLHRLLLQRPALRRSFGSAQRPAISKATQQNAPAATGPPA